MSDPNASQPSPDYGQQPPTYGQQPPAYGQQPPVYGPQPGYPPQPPSSDFPGKTLGIIGLVLSFFTTIIGLVVSIIALRQSKKAGFKNTPALVGIIIGIITTVIAIILAIVMIVAAMALVSQCGQLGSGVHVVNGVTITCP